MFPWLARICWGCSIGCFTYSFVIQVISEKALYERVYLQFERCFYMKIIIAIILKISCKLTFILFLFFLPNQKQESGFHQDVYSKSCGLQSHAKFYRLYKGIFLHVISVCIIVPWFHLPCQTHAVCHTSKSRYSHSVGISFLHNFRKRSLKCWKLA